MGEFDLIRRYFSPPVNHTVLAGGDDAALVQPSVEMELAVSTDLLMGERHFFLDMDPARLACKAASVNLSDMAAMGAVPRWLLLGLSLPQYNEAWVAAFSQAFRDILALHGVDWVGGDTASGSWALAVTIMGEVPRGKALRRAGARCGDDIWVSGTLGDAALGLGYRRGDYPLDQPVARLAMERFELPTARLALGQALRGMAHAAIDLSDGLLADLGHILHASGVGAWVDLPAIPVSAYQPGMWYDKAWQQRVLQGGEDYELCFCVAPEHRPAILTLSDQLSLPLARIGGITAERAQRSLRDDQGCEVALAWRGFDHFCQT